MNTETYTIPSEYVYSKTNSPKTYIVCVINKITGEYVYSKTTNPKKRIKRLKYNIQSINGNGTAVFDRFKPFIGVNLETDVEFKVYQYSYSV